MGTSGLRDVFVFIVVFYSIPYILRRPHVGIYMWSWLAYMNPHKLSWGFAQTFPFSMVVALVTMTSILTNDKIKKEIYWCRESKLLLIFTIWMTFTTFFAFFPADAFQQWNKVWKIQLFTFLTMMLINDREKLTWLLFIIVVSIGLYGVKGGIFTLTTGGAYAVYGPSGTFIGGNNEIGLAMIMVIPWMRYLQLTATSINVGDYIPVLQNTVISQKWAKRFFTFTITTTMIATLGTQSRGALVGLLIMSSILFLKNIKQFGFVVFAGLVFFLTVQFMPDTWHDRMGTIETYEQDNSALGRINAWWMAYNLAVDNPITGGGFETFKPYTFWLYAPEPRRVHDAHSIWFEILGEHGFIGFGMFLLLGVFVLLSSRRIMKKTKNVPGLEWLFHLASMMQVSIIGYAAAGTFLGLAYFDLLYCLVAVVVIAQKLTKEELAKRDLEEENEVGAPKLKKARMAYR